MLLPSLLAAKNNGGELAGMLLVLFCLFGTEYAFFFFLVLVLLAITCPTIYSDAWMDGGNGRGAECGGNAPTVREPNSMERLVRRRPGRATRQRERANRCVRSGTRFSPLPSLLHQACFYLSLSERRGEGGGEGGYMPTGS